MRDYPGNHRTGVHVRNTRGGRHVTPSKDVRGGAYKVAPVIAGVNGTSKPGTVGAAPGFTQSQSKRCKSSQRTVQPTILLRFFGLWPCGHAVWQEY
jgi:hypothetical protein